MSQALYRKWRPQKWDQVVGQEHVVQTLRNAIVADRVAHAYLFAGPRGTGKTTSARLLAKAVNCLQEDLSARPCDDCDHCAAVNENRFLDLIEIDAASNTSVDDVRDLREKINFAPNQGKFKVYIVDEVHMLSTAAFNALLKTLEEPPSHAMFILATTEAHKIPATVKSRCQPHEFRRIPPNEIVRQLEMITQEEGISIEDEALALIARQATGALRDAISLLDQLSSGNKMITHQIAQDVLGTATNQTVLEIIDAVLAKDANVGLSHLHQALDAGADPRQFSHQIVDHLRNLLLIQMATAPALDASPEIRQRMAEQAQGFDAAGLLRVISAFSNAATEARSNWQPALPLELAFVEAITDPQQVVAPVAPAPSPKNAAPTPQRKLPPQNNPEPAVEMNSELQEIRKKWRLVRDEVKKENSSTEGLLNSCKLLEVKGNDIYLGFVSEVLKTKMDEPDRLVATEAAIEKVMGRKYKLRCVIASGNTDLPEEVQSDGMVAAAMRLGGQVVHASEVSKKGKQSKKQ
jgi:DNA polymerase-3 subunit gamma/tau